MAGNNEERESKIKTKELDEEMFDNDEGFDLGGGSDEDVEPEETEELDEDFDAEDDELDESDDEEGAEEQGDKVESEDEESAEPKDKGSKSAAEEAGAKLENTALEEERAKRLKLEAQTKKTLEALGFKVGGSVEDALDRAAAEAEGVSLEEYRKQQREADEVASAKEQIRRQKFEELATRDLAELKKSFPDVLEKGNIRDCFDNFDDFFKFGRLRDNGIGAKEAYMAVYGDRVLAKQSQAAQQKAAGNGKGHIHSVAPKKTTDEMVVMPQEVLKEWREIFPDKTDKEIRHLYRETLN